jgi:hypothetical protein
MGRRHTRRLVADRSSPSFSSRARHRRRGHNCYGRRTHPEVRRGGSGLYRMPPASYMRSREVVIDAAEASSGFSAEYVAVSAEGVAHLPMGLDDALELQRGQAVVIHGAAGGALCSTRVRCCRAGFAFFPSRSSFSDKRLPGDQRPARQSPKLHP